MCLNARGVFFLTEPAVAQAKKSGSLVFLVPDETKRAPRGARCRRLL